jgi:hypothetical protein
MPAPHALCSKMLAERTASRNVFVLFYFIFILFISPLATLWLRLSFCLRCLYSSYSLTLGAVGTWVTVHPHVAAVVCACRAG